MKSTLALVLSIAVIAACGVLIADESSAQPEFPSFNEIVQEFRFPAYSFDRFVSDAQTMFSESMFRQMGDYGGNLISFIAEDTFVADIGSGNLADSFTGGNYINIFVLVCFIIAIICVLGALISYAVNRKTFLMERED